MGMSIETITPRLEHRTVLCPTGKFETWMQDGKPVLRREKGYEWFNYENPPTLYDCRATGQYDRVIDEQEFNKLLSEYKKAA